MESTLKKKKTDPDIPLSDRLEKITERNPDLFRALATDNRKEIKE